MSDINEIRKKRMEELQKLQDQNQNSQQEEMQMQQQIQQLESIVKQALSKEALERYGNLKAAYPDKAVQILVVLANAIQQGQIKEIDDNTLKEILKKLSPKKKDIKIKRV